MTQSNRERLRAAEVAKAKQQRFNRIIGVGAAILAVVLIGVFAVVLVQQSQQAATSSSVTPPNATQAQDAITVNPGRAQQGAPVVELFFDYQCPACKQFENAYGSALAGLADAGEIELRYRTMTFLDGNLKNDSSLRSGIAAACADVVGAYSPYHDQVFANQPAGEGSGYPDSVLRDTIPGAAGITGDALTTFQACFDSQATKAFVNGTNEKASRDKVRSTPTFRVNGNDLPLQTIGQVAPADLGNLIRQNA